MTGPAGEGRFNRAVCVEAVVAVLAVLAGAWIAAGSAGLVARPLGRMLVLVCLVAGTMAVWPPVARAGRGVLWAVLGVLIGMGLLAHPSPAVNILAAAVMAVLLGYALAGPEGIVLSTCGAAVCAFAVYRGVVTSVPWAWLAADRLSRYAGSLAAWLAGQAMDVGGTFAGLDLIVLTGLFWAGLLVVSPGRRLARGLYGVAGMAGAHLAYLVALAYVPQLMAAVEVPAGQAPGLWAGLVHKAIPWNLPAVGCVLQAAVVAGMLRWPLWGPCARRTVGRRWLIWSVLAAAILAPIAAFAHPLRPDLTGRRIVFYEKGFLNWLKPRHGQYGRLSSGMYGMLPEFVASLGANAVISPDLSAEDLSGADAVVLIFPDDPWQPGQQQRLWQYVRDGGTLLVMGEHTTVDPNGSNRFNEILEPTNIRIAFDSATFAVGGWLHSYEPIMHPTTAGLEDDQNQFGVVIGASVQIEWPARPLLIGKWGWSDAGEVGSTRAMMGDDRYNPGERLGDICLAAEQPLGKGLVVAFGDTSGLTNGINTGSYVFTSRLVAYLAARGSQAHPCWRQVVAVLLGSYVIFGLVGMCRATIGLLAGLAFGVSWWACQGVTAQAWQVIPHRRQEGPVRIAYIDSSHIPAYSSESWRPDGMGGMALTLMRNDYLVLDLPELTERRLEGADLLMVVAPARAYGQTEIEAIRRFVERGGCLIVTVGYERVAPSKGLLGAFGFYVGQDPNYQREPAALGHFKSPYLRSEHKMVYVRFHAAWPVGSNDPNTRVIAYGAEGRPVIMARRVGSGKVVVVGDTCFATCKNLENEDGSPFEGMRENADFWRWFITILREEQMWIPEALAHSPPGQEGQAQ